MKRGFCPGLRRGESPIIKPSPTTTRNRVGTVGRVSVSLTSFFYRGPIILVCGPEVWEGRGRQEAKRLLREGILATGGTLSM